MVRIERQRAAHADGLFAALSDARTYKFLDEEPPASADAVRDRIVRLRSGASPESGEVWLNWTVFDGDAIVGYTQATIDREGVADLAYVLHPDAWGRSIGHRACLLSLGELRSRPDVRRIVADTKATNRRSHALLARLGFVRTHGDGRDVFYELKGEPIERD